MEGKGVRLMAAVVVVILVVISSQPQSASANLFKISCIGICMRECRIAGISTPVCLKYCPVHCVPPLLSHQTFHCSLECINQCVNTNNNNNDNNGNNGTDEENQDSCVSNCKNDKCNPSP